MKNNSSQIKIFFFSFWILGLILQAFFTEIMDDEAYYWMYSRQLAWGYFDHPPVIAVFIKLGYALFQNELGVRIISILSIAFSINIWEKIVQPKQLKLFYMIILSVGILHFIGFMAIPDTPLLLFASIYLLLFKKFLEKPDWILSTLLAITIALMMLSKYHAVLIVGLTILPNLKLLKTPYFWFIAIASVGLLTPHILWQFNTDFPSIKYHLFDRSTKAYQITNTLEYLGTQPFILGPFTGVIFLISAWKYKIKTSFEYTLKFLFFGGYLFFLIMTFKGRAEAHWTLFVIIPAVYFGYYYLSETEKLRNIFYKLFPITMVLILAARLVVAVNFFPNTPFFANFHGKKLWFQNIQKKAGDLPVAFMNSYQKASLYQFYTQKSGFSLNSIYGRKNQFDIWKVEDKFRNQDIVLIPNYDAKNYELVNAKPKPFRYKIIKNFQAFSKIEIDVLTPIKTLNVLEKIDIEIQLKNSENDFVDFELDSNQVSYITYSFFKENRNFKSKRLMRISNEMLNKATRISIEAPKESGNFGLYISISTGVLPATFNSRRYPIEVLSN